MALPTQQQILQRVGTGVLYSTVFLGSGSGALANSVQQFFGYGLGQNAPGAAVASTICETNATTGGMLPTDRAFEVHEVGLQVYDTAATKVSLSYSDLGNLINGSMLQWKFQQTIIDLCSTLQAQAYGGVYGVAGTANNIPAALNNGAGGCHKLPRPTTIYPGAAFNVVWTFPSYAGTLSATSIACRLMFKGEYRTLVAGG